MGRINPRLRLLPGIPRETCSLCARMSREQAIEVVAVASRAYIVPAWAVFLGCFPSVGPDVAIEKTEIATLIMAVRRKPCPLSEMWRLFDDEVPSCDIASCVARFDK